ncbi:MAG: sigma-54 dependent transcriptional regulator [Ignavibacteriaceae bacterium]|jgi:DNA-binding NtrC family response regulator
MNKGNILIIDDEEELRRLLSKLLSLEGFRIFEAADAKSACDMLNKEEFHVVITDVKLPDASGIDLISKIKEYNPLSEIIVLTAYGTIHDGVRAIKEGAFDYIIKGDDDNKIISITEKAMEKARMGYRIEQLEKKVEKRFNFDNITGNSRLLLDAIEVAKKVADTDTTVLIEGETGTGKDLLAQSIHYSGSRRSKPFVAINCSSFSKELLESEMFGYKTGAFTGANKNKKGLFEEANLGTLFLDEIGEMDISLQAKLLRVIETGSFIKLGDTKPTSVDIRIIAATNRNLEDEIEKGNFRADLFYRIGVMKIELPALRNRKEDIPSLIESYVNVYREKLKRTIKEIDPGFIKRLTEYNFPGNIRELKNLIERAIILTTGNVLKESSLPAELLSHKNDSLPKNITEYASLEELEKVHITKILDYTEGNKTKAAEILGIGLTTLYRKLQSYGIE